MSDVDLQDAAGGPRLGSADPGGRTNPGAGIPLVVAVGIGGRIELMTEQVRLTKGGVFGHAVELLWNRSFYRIKAWIDRWPDGAPP